MTASIKIADKLIGRGAQPFIIAEMSGNHNQSLDRALKIVQAAAEAGAHAIKLQTYTADTITLDIKKAEFVINDEQFVETHSTFEAAALALVATFSTAEGWVGGVVVSRVDAD